MNQKEVNHTKRNLQAVERLQAPYSSKSKPAAWKSLLLQPSSIKARDACAVVTQLLSQGNFQPFGEGKLKLRSVNWEHAAGGYDVLGDDLLSPAWRVDARLRCSRCCLRRKSVATPQSKCAPSSSPGTSWVKGCALVSSPWPWNKLGIFIKT